MFVGRGGVCHERHAPGPATTPMTPQIEAAKTMSNARMETPRNAHRRTVRAAEPEMRDRSHPRRLGGPYESNGHLASTFTAYDETNSRTSCHRRTTSLSARTHQASSPDLARAS